MLIVRMAPISANITIKDKMRNSFKRILFFLLAPVHPSRPVYRSLRVKELDCTKRLDKVPCFNI